MSPTVMAPAASGNSSSYLSPNVFKANGPCWVPPFRLNTSSTRSTARLSVARAVTMGGQGGHLVDEGLVRQRGRFGVVAHGEGPGILDPVVGAIDGETQVVRRGQVVFDQPAAGQPGNPRADVSPPVAVRFVRVQALPLARQ